MENQGKFIGPLPKDIYQEVVDEIHLPPTSRLVEEIAREKYGRRMAQLALNEALEKLENSKVDQMTGFLRRDAFLEELQKSLDGFYRDHQGRKGDSDAALFIMLDIVGLHDINNSGGQAAGDKAIKATADFIRQIARREDIDIKGRLGGDEFAVFMPYNRRNVGYQGIIGKVSERIERVRAVDDTGADNVPAIRLRYESVGYDKELLTVEELLVQADPKRPGSQAIYSHPAQLPNFI